MTDIQEIVLAALLRSAANVHTLAERLRSETNYYPDQRSSVAAATICVGRLRKLSLVSKIGGLWYATPRAHKQCAEVQKQVHPVSEIS